MRCRVEFKEKKERVDMYANGENGKLKVTYPDCGLLYFHTIAEARKAVAFYGEGEIYDHKNNRRY